MQRSFFVLATLALSSPYMIAQQGGGQGGGHAGPDPNRAELLRADWRSIDGRDNNPVHTDWGRAGEPFARFTPADYADGVSAPSGSTRPSARAISNQVAAQRGDLPNSRGLSNLFWQWGQFIDHDLDETPGSDPAEAFDILVPYGDPEFDPFATGAQVITLNRSHYEVSAGIAEQVNELTSYLDASNVYGSDPVRAAALRTLDGTGRLKVSAGNLLPYNTAGLPNAPSDDPAYFLAGDVRANEQVALTAMHTVWVREHNSWCELLALAAPSGRATGGSATGSHPNQRQRHGPNLLNRSWSGETIYQIARALVVAEMQAITYREFLPLLLGAGSMSPYQGYDPSVDATISNEFATAAYRFGHTMLPSTFDLLGPNGELVAGGSIDLASAFFAPDTFAGLGVTPLVHGQVKQLAQELDPYVVDDIRNFLFGPPGAGGFDLASLNLQRGRDHGLGSLNDLRQGMGLPRHASFVSWTNDLVVRANLESTYGDVNEVDAWIGGLSERTLPGAVVGPTFHRVLRRQFTVMRDGDRFWYERYLPANLVRLVEAQTLAVVLRRATGLGQQIQPNPFLAQ